MEANLSQCCQRHVREVKEFHTCLKSKEIPWEKGYEQENSRKKGEFTTYLTYEEAKSQEGYRIVWVHSDTKAQQDAFRRRSKVAEACKELQTLASKLNRYQLKTRDQIQQAIDKAVKGVGDYVTYTIKEHTTIVKKQIGRGKAGPNTSFKEESHTSYQLEWQRNIQAMKEASCTDGVFPLISNTELSALEVLRTYKQQSYLEKRHSTLKTVEKVCPIYLKKPQRIEAMLFLYFVALMIISLIERNIRRNMQEVTAEDFAQVEPIIMPENKPVALPKVVAHPKKRRAVSVKRRNISTEQTTSSGNIFLFPEEKQTAWPGKQNAVSEEEKQTILVEQQTVLSTEQTTSTKQNLLPREEKQTVLSEEITLLPEAVSKRIALPEEKQTTTLPEERIALQNSLPEEKQTTTLPEERSTLQNALPEEKQTTTLPEERITLQNALPEEKQTTTLPEERITLQNALPEEKQTTTLPEKEVQKTLPPQKKQPILPNKQRNLPEERIALPILPQGMKTETPTWENIKYCFRNVYQIVITSDGGILKTILKGMTPLHFQVLELLDVPSSIYNDLQGPWWRFQEG